jgi:hypothetical protein
VFAGEAAAGMSKSALNALLDINKINDLAQFHG